MLTAKQKCLLDFLKSYVAEHGYGPTYEEMAVSQGVGSKSGIYRLIEGLEDRGFIRRIPYMARAIEIVDRTRESEIARARKDAYDQGYRAAMAEMGLPLVGRAA